MTATTDLKLGISLAIAIAMHNIPEGISISIPIYYSTKSKFTALFYTLFAGLSEFFGAILAYLFLTDLNISFFLTFLYLVIAGIMVGLVFEELFPVSLRYLKKFSSLLWFMIGFIFMQFFI